LDLVELIELKNKSREIPKRSPEQVAIEIKRADEFINNHGPLRMVFHLVQPARKTYAEITPAETVRVWSLFFAAALYESVHDQEEFTNHVLSDIFTEVVGKPGEERVGFRVDFLRSTVEPIARDLLDAIAIEMIRSRKSIARCVLCSKFFQRQWNKDKYCSPLCGDEARRKGQLEWVQKARAKKKLETKKGRKSR